jgi:CDP-diacylglycerol--glycerol-3-phosphate 3-phosphatidyltransferase
MTLASKVTLLRVAMIPVFVVFMYLSGGRTGIWSYCSLAVFIAASITDFIDGQIARRQNQVSNFGKFLDPLADKLLVISAMVILSQWRIFPAWILIVVLTREFAVTGLRLIAVESGKVIAAGLSGKIKTACTMVGLCFVLAFPDAYILGVVVSWVVLITTVYSGVEYFVRNWKVLGLK